MYIKATTIDDLLHAVLSKLLKSKDRVVATKGSTTEITGVLLELKNPRARLSRTQTKGTIFSCLGELLWYLAGANDLEFIRHYISDYGKYSDDGRTLYGAYGPRLFGTKGKRHNQIANVTNLLKKKPTSRKAVIQIFSARDITGPTEDVPCTCTLQFFVRRRRLHLVVHMRSNDAFLGMPHDIFSFTMLQEIIARSLGVGVGRYIHAVGSLHLYLKNRKSAKEYLRAGWQPTNIAMPAMPAKNPWPAIRRLLTIERKLRKGEVVEIRGLQPYWADLARLLSVFAQFKKRDADGIARVRKQMSARVYDRYVEDKRQSIK